ncbi:MAG: hypothetical protein ABI655_07210 [Phenylobacterium sp.]
MTRKTQLFVWSLIVAMALVALGILVWRADDFANFAGLTHRERIKLIGYTVALLFVPAWLALGTLATNWMFTRAMVAWPLADDQRRFAERSLIAAAIFSAGVQVWMAVAAVLGEPPGREFGVRLIEAIAGILFFITANFAAKTSPPQGWHDPGRWIRATLRTGWVGVAAGVVILVSAIAAPVGSVVWIVGGASGVYVLAGVLNHLGARRKSA